MGRFVSDPVLAVNHRGDLAVAWGADEGAGVAIRHRGHWRRPHLFKSVISAPDEVQVAIAPGGRVLVMWPRSTEEESQFTRRHLAWARTRFDGTWTRVRYLDTRRTVVLART